MTWHHLVMTAGNFKRQAAISLPKIQDPRNAAHAMGDQVSFRIEVKGERKTVTHDDADSWKHLTGIDSIGVATATTILSALWPGSHVIADRRDMVAAVGLAYEEALHDGLLRVAGYVGEVVSWERYRWFRPKVIARANAIGVEAVQVERALYEIDVATNPSTTSREAQREAGL